MDEKKKFSEDWREIINYMLPNLPEEEIDDILSAEYKAKYGT